MHYILIITLKIFGLIISLTGLIGCILPVIPGPPLSFLALLILSFAEDWQPFSFRFLTIMGVLTVIVTLLDYVLMSAGAKKFGASKTGVWFSIFGMITGIFLFPPWGILLGALAGAITGELLSGRTGSMALRAGFGVFVGNIMGVGLKLALSGIMLFFYVTELF
ncbi:MAG: DUF456 domain-containing protein [Deltaproteobacteria bacterium]|nr:DUF456 domain-containing protein [Deltaproteobacteria bacterium]